MKFPAKKQTTNKVTPLGPSFMRRGALAPAIKEMGAKSTSQQKDKKKNQIKKR